MAIFVSNKIENNKDLIGRELERVRASQKLTLKMVAKSLGIREKYLEALEQGRYERLPQGLYGRNFLREYAKYLRLDERKILEIYDDYSDSGSIKKQEDVFTRKVPQFQYFVTIPRLIKNLLLGIGVLICLGYLGYYINNIISPPKLIIISPEYDKTVKESSILVSGQTEDDAEVAINDEKVLIDKEGGFAKNISLKSGLNIINIVAQKKYSRKNIVERKILLEE